MTSKTFFCVLVSLASLLGAELFAVSLPTAPVIKQAEPLFGTRLKPIRVRIGVDYSKYEAVLFKNKLGKAYYKATLAGRKFHTLRTRLEQKNSFFFSGLRVETWPVSWNKDTKKYKVRLEFYQTYGVKGTLEDHLGSIVADGVLDGKGRVLNFLGQTQKIFKNPKGVKIADIRVGTPRNVMDQAQRVSKLNTNSIKKN